jgi:putative ABC transport system permease protein
MRLSSISVNNLRRRKGKMAFLTIGLLIGIATMVTMFSITEAMKADTERKLDQYGANIVITPKANDLALVYGGIAVSGVSYDVKELNEEDAEKIRTIPNAENISTLAPKLLGASTIDGQQFLLVGVDFKQEMLLKKWWEIEGQEPKISSDIVLGYLAAEKLNKWAGDTIEINGQQFKVAGTIQETGSQEDALVYADLGAVQELLGKPGKLSMIEVSALCSTCPIEDIVMQIGEKLPGAKVSALKQAVKAREQTVEQLGNFSLAISVVVLLVAALIVLTTMMSSVNERTREIGIFRAVGFRKIHVMIIILTEALLVSSFGGLLGWLIGTLASGAVAPHLAQLTIGVQWNPLLGGIAVALAIVVGVGSTIYPAVRASNLDPAEALRFI